jgi:amino acid transporter
VREKEIDRGLPGGKPIVMAAKEPKDSKKSFALDAAIILAGITGLIYYAHFIYLYYYYDFFGVQLVDLHYSLQEVMMVNPNIVIGLILFVGMAIVMCRHMDDGQIKPLEIRSWWLRLLVLITGMIVCLYAIIFLSFMVKYLADKEAVKFVNERQPVVFELKGKSVHDYYYLARSEDYFYFFKVAENGRPLPLVVKAEDVREISYDKDLP